MILLCRECQSISLEWVEEKDNENNQLIRCQKCGQLHNFCKFTN